MTTPKMIAAIRKRWSATSFPEQVFTAHAKQDINTLLAALAEAERERDRLTGEIKEPRCNECEVVLGDNWCANCAGKIDREIAELLRAEITSLREGQQWQDIETAPKDGTEVLLVWHPSMPNKVNPPVVVMARWQCRMHSHLSDCHNCPLDADCRMGWDNYGGTMSHWMPKPAPAPPPLPSPPAATPEASRYNATWPHMREDGTIEQRPMTDRDFEQFCKAVGVDLPPATPEVQDGWVTFGRITSNPETETEIFERIPVVTPEVNTERCKHGKAGYCYDCMSKAVS